MQPRDKISKSSWTLLEGIKDAVAANVTNAVRTGQLKIEAAQIEKLLTIIAASADEGYHRGHRTFMKVSDTALTEAARDASLEAEMPSLGKSPGSKKK